MNEKNIEIKCGFNKFVLAKTKKDDITLLKAEIK